MTDPIPSIGSRPHPRAALPVIVGSAALLLVGLYTVAHTGQGDLSRLIVMFAVAAQDGALVAGWWVAALGYGLLLSRLCCGKNQHDTLTSLALGGGALLMLAWSLGWAGWLNSATAWAALLIGWLIAGMWLWRRAPQWRAGVNRPALPWPAMLALPSAGLLLGTAMIAPGILWSPTEFGGYDTLSYHIQLPREWMQLGAITGLHHNVYSYLPNLFEAGYLHLGYLRGSVVAASLSCQLLHASMALAAAWTVARIVRTLLHDPLSPWLALSLSKGQRAGVRASSLSLGERVEVRGPANTEDFIASVAPATAAAIYLATPWTIVTGSLAYSEQAVNFFGAVALLTVIRNQQTPARRGLIAGLFVGLAAMCKLTSLLMFAPPLAIVLLMRGGPHFSGAVASTWRARLIGLIVYLVATLAILSPYAIRNTLWTANPVFPFATSVFGSAHWSVEQAARWQAAHQPSMNWADRASHLWSQLLNHPQYGYIVMPAMLIGLAVGLSRRALRPTALQLTVMSILMLAAWLTLTHVQSRFILPLLIPAAVACGLLIAIAPARLREAAVLLILGWLSLASFDLYRTQLNGQAGLYLDGMVVAQQQSQPYAAINQLPESSRIYAEGWAIPFYARRPVDYRTVWDASPLGQLLDQHGLTGALAAMGSSGYTHLLIDYAMIQRWQSDGNYGYDSKLTPDRLRAIADADLPVVYADPNGGLILYQLPAAHD